MRLCLCSAALLLVLLFALPAQCITTDGVDSYVQNEGLGYAINDQRPESEPGAAVADRRIADSVSSQPDPAVATVAQRSGGDGYTHAQSQPQPRPEAPAPAAASPPVHARAPAADQGGRKSGVGPIPPDLPDNFAATWVYSCPPYNMSVAQAGWLAAAQLNNQLFWRVDTMFPLVNRTEVSQLYANGTFTTGSLWYSYSYNLELGPAGEDGDLLAAQVGPTPQPAPVISGYVCSPNITEIGVDGLKLDWLSSFATNFSGVEVLNGVQCQHWSLVVFNACYDLWLTDDAASIPVRFELSALERIGPSKLACSTDIKRFDYTSFQGVTAEQAVADIVPPSVCANTCTLPRPSPSPHRPSSYHPSLLLLCLCCVGCLCVGGVGGWACMARRHAAAASGKLDYSIVDVLE